MKQNNALNLKHDLYTIRVSLKLIYHIAEMCVSHQDIQAEREGDWYEVMFWLHCWFFVLKQPHVILCFRLSVLNQHQFLFFVFLLG